MTGNEYKHLIARYVMSAYGARGLHVYDEVHVGTSIIGKRRRIDLFLHVPTTNKVLGLECKYQDSSGTADEKIPYALQDLAALRMPACIVYAGAGFSTGVLHLLQGSESAAYCLPDADMQPIARPQTGSLDYGTWQLDHILAVTFDWWDIVLAGKSPLLI